MDRRSGRHRTQRYREHRSDGKSGTSRSITVHRDESEAYDDDQQLFGRIGFKLTLLLFSGEVQALCLPNQIYVLVIENIPGVHPDILGNSGMNTAKEMYQEKVIPYIEAGECVVTPFNSGGRVAPIFVMFARTIN